MIDTIFYFVEHEADYLAQRENISPKTIVFVQDTHEIYLNGWAYGKTSTEGLATVDDYNTVVDALNTSRENINLIYQQLATLRTNIEREIEESVEQAFTDEESIRNNAVLNGQIDQKIGEWASQAYLVTTDSTTWTNLTQSVNSISARATQIDHNFDGTGDIKQSVFESGVTSTTAYTNLASRWAVADANQRVIKWLASGFASQADDNTTFADVYSAAQDNTSDAISNIHTEIENLDNTYVAKASLVTEVQNKASQIRTAAGVYSKSQVDNAVAGIWSENVSGTNKTLSQILTQANADSATLALKVDAGDVSAAITASVQPGGTVADYISTITITADQINLNGLVTALNARIDDLIVSELKTSSSTGLKSILDSTGLHVFNYDPNETGFGHKYMTISDEALDIILQGRYANSSSELDADSLVFSGPVADSAAPADQSLFSANYGLKSIQINAPTDTNGGLYNFSVGFEDSSNSSAHYFTSYVYAYSMRTDELIIINRSPNGSNYRLDISAAVTAGILVPVSNS